MTVLRWMALTLWAAATALAAAAPAAAVSVPDTALPDTVARAAKSLNVPESGISLWVQPVDRARPEIAFNADVPRNPASTLKLVTTYAVLQGLGPAYTWRTDVFLEQPPKAGRVAGDVWVRGYGDPYLVAEEYWKLADQLRKRGIRRIDGDLVFDDSYFQLDSEDPGAFDHQPNRVYNLPPAPLLVNFNAVRFVVRPDADGHSVEVSPDPPLPNLELTNRLELYQAPCVGYQRGVAVDVEADTRDRVLLEGRFPTGCDEYALTRTVLRPESYAFGLFDLYWQDLGGELKGRWRLGKVPESLSKPFIEHRSRPLGDIIRLVNKYSNNVMTRNLELTLGAETYGPPATEDKGRKAVFEVLAANGIDTDGLVFSNSAGLSRDSRISARQLAGVLAAAWKGPFMPEFLSSLSIAGLDGTMSQRLAGTDAAGRMHLKTGTLDDVSAVAGYVLTTSGRRLIVVMLINAKDAHRGPGEDLEDATLRWLMHH